MKPNYLYPAELHDLTINEGVALATAEGISAEYVRSLMPSYDDVCAHVIEPYLAQFSVSERLALEDFLLTPTGQKFISTMGAIVYGINDYFNAVLVQRTQVR